MHSTCCEICYPYELGPAQTLERLINDGLWAFAVDAGFIVSAGIDASESKEFTSRCHKDDEHIRAQFLCATNPLCI